MASTIEYTVEGSFTPFMVLLKDDLTDTTIDSALVHTAGVSQSFYNVPTGDYIIESYDTANGVNVKPATVP